jgi:hypothetical protein
MFAAGHARLADPVLRNGCAEFLEAFAGWRAWVLHAENVKFHNSLQVGNAERFIFASRQDFAMAREMIASHPNLKMGPRAEMVGRPRRR